MKNVILTAITALMLLSTSAWCTVITVSNLPNSPGQYSDLQEAINASSGGDTILVSGSPVSYDSVAVIKPLTIIGDGYNRRPSPDNSNYYPDGYNSIAAFDIRSFWVHISGFRTQIKMVSDYSSPIDQVTVERCWIDDNFGGFNTSVEIIGSDIDSYPGVDNIKFVNNIFGYQGEISFLPSLFGIGSVIFSNNIFFETRLSAPYRVSRAMIVFMHNNFFGTNNTEIFNSTNFTDIIIKDNIFYKSNPLVDSSCAYINNLLFEIDTIFPNEDHVDTGNIFADPSFIDYTDSLDFFEQDFNLNPDSEARNAASDGTDIGITGGAYPFNAGDTPSWAEVIKLTLSNSTIPTNVTINATFEGKGNN